MTAFLDTNVVIYARGREPTLQAATHSILDWGGENPGAFCSNAEVLQELLHLALRRTVGAPFAETSQGLLLATHGTIEPTLPGDVVAAGQLDVPGLSARDRIHVAVMQRIGVTQIISTDRGFDRVPDVTRLDPLRFEEWRDGLLDEGAEG